MKRNWSQRWLKPIPFPRLSLTAILTYQDFIDTIFVHIDDFKPWKPATWKESGTTGMRPRTYMMSPPSVL